ncbi:MAG: DUF1566 domain-containing protein [Nitrospira sp.]|nr:DUF1566 domain-containing protein [Nitrospira sp.]
MNTIQRIWPGAVVGIVLIGGGLLMSYETEVPSAGLQAALVHQPPVLSSNPSQIIADIGSGSGQASNSSSQGDTDNSSASRFVVAFPGAVLDKHTGLVWEETPDATPRTWADATRYCVTKTVGGTIGWRLPSVAELKSLQDLSMAPPFVPASVFSDVESTSYWSAGAPTGVSFVHLVDDRVSSGNTSHTFPAWCVRGGVNTEQY